MEIKGTGAGRRPLNVRFLIDECLSVALVAMAKERSCHADHVAYIGKSGWQDWNVASFALANDYLLVTNNRRDFLREYARADVHPGLIILIPNVDGADQRRLFGKAFEAVAALDDPVNRLIEVAADGSAHVRTWTRLDNDLGHISRPVWG
jgi:predicted nuclease of predicted toxin-antitoxin system